MSERDDDRGLLALVLALVLLTHACAPVATAAYRPPSPGVAPYVWIPWWASPAVLCLGGARMAWSPVDGWECAE